MKLVNDRIEGCWKAYELRRAWKVTLLPSTVWSLLGALFGSSVLLAMAVPTFLAALYLMRRERQVQAEWLIRHLTGDTHGNTQAGP